MLPCNLTELVDELQDLRKTIDGGEMGLIAQNGLDPSYDSFVIAHTAKVDNINFAAFHGLLWAHEERLKR